MRVRKLLVGICIAIFLSAIASASTIKYTADFEDGTIPDWIGVNKGVLATQNGNTYLKINRNPTNITTTTSAYKIQYPNMNCDLSKIVKRIAGKIYFQIDIGWDNQYNDIYGSIFLKIYPDNGSYKILTGKYDDSYIQVMMEYYGEVQMPSVINATPEHRLFLNMFLIWRNPNNKVSIMKIYAEDTGWFTGDDGYKNLTRIIRVKMEVTNDMATIDITPIVPYIKNKVTKTINIKRINTLNTINIYALNLWNTTNQTAPYMYVDNIAVGYEKKSLISYMADIWWFIAIILIATVIIAVIIWLKG